MILTRMKLASILEEHRSEYNYIPDIPISSNDSRLTDEICDYYFSEYRKRRNDPDLIAELNLLTLMKLGYTWEGDENDPNLENNFQQSLNGENMRAPAFETLRLIASSDQSLFENIMGQIGLKVIGTIDSDPLRKNVQNESVQSIASYLTEDRKWTDDSYLIKAKKIADEYGYITEMIK